MNDNKLIAEFMGHMWETECPFEQDDFDNREMKYHTSWDWLMPVVEKIINTNTYAQQRQKVYKSITPNINHTYKAVVEFIKNQNK